MADDTNNAKSATV